MSDLKGRAEELEREAADLRRENGWLKEIVMLKGSRLAGSNLSPEMLAGSSSAASVPRTEIDKRHGGTSVEQEDSQSDGSTSDEDYQVGRSKAKGKGKGKGKHK